MSLEELAVDHREMIGNGTKREAGQEGQAAGMAYKAQLDAERAAGRPSSCPPKGVRPSSDQVLAHLRTYPAEARGRINMRTAIGDMFKKTWPCR